MIIWCPPVEGLPCKTFIDPPALIHHLEEKGGDAGFHCEPLPEQETA